MLKLIVSGNEVQVWHRKTEHDVLIDQITRLKVPNAEWSDKYKDGDWDGLKHLYSKKTGRFPVGMLDDVEMYLLIDDVEYEIIDKRDYENIESVNFSYRPTFDPRNYQTEATRVALNKKRGVISLPTGTGKTEVAQMLIAALGTSAIVYVGRERLLKQTVERFREVFNTKIGMVGDGVVDIRPITVATVQTAYRLPAKMFADFGITIVDECHHAAADTVYDLTQASQSPYLFGLSATPTREDGLELLIQAAIGPIIYKKTTTEMIEAGYLARPEIEVIHVSPITFTQKEPYIDVVQRAVINNRERNQLIATTAVQESVVGKVYVHVNRLEHGPILRDLINKKILKKEKGRHAKWIHGKTKTAEKDKVMDEFRNGDLKILISTLLGEGVDVPEMYCLIMAAGGGKAKKVAVPQIMGRVLRQSQHATVKFYDIMDRCKYLYDHFLERCDYYNSEDAFQVDPVIAKMKK